MTKIELPPSHRRTGRSWIYGAAAVILIILVNINTYHFHVALTDTTDGNTDVGVNKYPVLQLLDGLHDPFANPQSKIVWCFGKNSAGRCDHPNQVISVTNDLQIFSLLLRRAMDARRDMTSLEHEHLKKTFSNKLIRDEPFQADGPGAYWVYSLYGHVLSTPGLVQVQKNDLWLEFGVYTGASCNVTGYSQPSLQVHGFDTFTGLPEAWEGHHDKGHFGLGGILPPVEKNVVLHKGLFSETLPGVLKANRRKRIAGMNIDCDLYQGAIESLNLTYPMWTPGTILHFHELQQSTKSKELVFAKQEEVRALFEFLVTHPGTVLEMLPVRNAYAEPVVFVVVQPPKK